MAETITYPALLTNQGLAKIAAAIANSTTVSLATIAVGDGNGNPTTPSATQTALVRATSVQAISSLTYVGTQATCEALFPLDDGGYTIREFGVFDTDGVLIAVGATPDLPKPTTENGAVEHVQRVVFDVGNASAVTVEIDPSILLASRQWVIDNYGIAVQIPGGTTGQVLAKRSNADGDTEWIDSGDANVIVDVIQETQTLSAGQTVVNLATCTTDGAAVYIGATAATLERLAPSEWTATSETVVTLDTGATAGHTILIAQNEPASPLTFLRRANCLSEIAADGSGNQESACENLGLPRGWDAIKLAILQAQMPVGYVVTLGVETSPETLYGFGTWEQITGKVIVGIASGDSDFGTLDGTGGAKTVTLTEAQLPAHAHAQQGTLTTSSTGSHSHSVQLPGKAGGDGYVTLNDGYGAGRTVTSGAAGAHAHSLTLTGNTATTGSGSAHTNLQPYITKYVWQRTA